MSAAAHSSVKTESRIKTIINGKSFMEEKFQIYHGTFHTCGAQNGLMYVRVSKVTVIGSRLVIKANGEAIMLLLSCDSN